ncbi:MAG TPA: serine hydrolase [Thermomicrobiales bacterium]|nr:serine hydrolase [Thermomicrobiales bacterium]
MGTEASETLDRRIDELIAAFDGEAAFLARNLSSGEEIGRSPNVVMPTASTIKILVLAELFRQVEQGTLGLDDPAPILPEDRRGGSGILKDLSLSLVPCVRDHATLMIALSDNTATMVLARLLGRERIEQSGREWGMTSTVLPLERTLNWKAEDYAVSTCRDVITLLSAIAEDRIISPAACAAMRDILLTQQFLEQIARYLPFNQYRREGYQHEGPLVVRSKSGFTADSSGAVRVDAGIVEIQDGPRWVICLMTSKCPEQGFIAEHPGSILNGRISRLIYDAWHAAR